MLNWQTTGCVRVVSKSAYPNGGITPSQVREVLAVFGTAELGLAHFRGGRLATFDRTIRPQWVTGAGDSDLELILRNPALS